MTTYDIVVVGASLGGVMAAVSACKLNKRVLLTEESIWIGGQLTSQAVPPDEHKWIEKTGATETYMKFRKEVRDYYRNLENIKEEIKDREEFCPGNSWVSRLAHEPKVALQILESYLQPYIEQGLLEVKYETIAVSASVINDEIKSVYLQQIKTKEIETVYASFFLDGTDCGDLLPLVNAEYRTGAESKAEFGEMHAPEHADPEDMQPITWVIAVEWVEDEKENYKIEKPECYEFFRDLRLDYDICPKLFSWYLPDAKTKKAKEFGFFDHEIEPGSLGLFSYRRISCQERFEYGGKEITLINWPQNDYSFGNIYDTKSAEHHKFLAKQLSLSYVYYLQHFAKRADGGIGYPIKPCGEVTGTEDGLALMPYIRESRRIVGEYTIKEQDVSKRCNEDLVCFEDSIGVGSYEIDLHMTTKSKTFLFDQAQPFEIPLGSMIPVRLKNLIPACKNISCTHLTNGCYRLHPVEWNIGEVAGLLAAYSMDHALSLKEIRQKHITDFQQFLEKQGIQLHWNKGEIIKTHGGKHE